MVETVCHDVHPPSELEEALNGAVSGSPWNRAVARFIRHRSSLILASICRRHCEPRRLYLADGDELAGRVIYVT